MKERLRLAEGGAICAGQIVEVIDVKQRTVLTKTGASMVLAPEAMRVLQRLRENIINEKKGTR